MMLCTIIWFIETIVNYFEISTCIILRFIQKHAQEQAVNLLNS